MKDNNVKAQNKNNKTTIHVKKNGKGNRSIPPPESAVYPGDGGAVLEPNENDVLSGRGGRINSHIGNVRFRELVADLKPTYLSKHTKKLEKAHIASQIVQQIRSMDPPGRFLKEDPPTGFWYDIGDEKARKKAGQALREDAPDIRHEMEEVEEEDVEEKVEKKSSGDDMAKKNIGSGQNDKQEETVLGSAVSASSAAGPSKKTSSLFSFAVAGNSTAKPFEAIAKKGFLVAAKKGRLGSAENTAAEIVERLKSESVSVGSGRSASGDGGGSTTGAGASDAESMPPPPRFFNNALAAAAASRISSPLSQNLPPPAEEDEHQSSGDEEGSNKTDDAVNDDDKNTSTDPQRPATSSSSLAAPSITEGAPVYHDYPGPHQLLIQQQLHRHQMPLMEAAQHQSLSFGLAADQSLQQQVDLVTAAVGGQSGQQDARQPLEISPLMSQLRQQQHQRLQPNLNLDASLQGESVAAAAAAAAAAGADVFNFAQHPVTGLINDAAAAAAAAAASSPNNSAAGSVFGKVFQPTPASVGSNSTLSTASSLSLDQMSSTELFNQLQLQQQQFQQQGGAMLFDRSSHNSRTSNLRARPLNFRLSQLEAYQQILGDAELPSPEEERRQQLQHLEVLQEYQQLQQGSTASSTDDPTATNTTATTATTAPSSDDPSNPLNTYTPATRLSRSNSFPPGTGSVFRSSSSSAASMMSFAADVDVEPLPGNLVQSAFDADDDDVNPVGLPHNVEVAKHSPSPEPSSKESHANTSFNSASRYTNSNSNVHTNTSFNSASRFTNSNSNVHTSNSTMRNTRNSSGHLNSNNNNSSNILRNSSKTTTSVISELTIPENILSRNDPKPRSSSGPLTGSQRSSSARNPTIGAVNLVIERQKRKRTSSNRSSRNTANSSQLGSIASGIFASNGAGGSLMSIDSSFRSSTSSWLLPYKDNDMAARQGSCGSVMSDLSSDLHALDLAEVALAQLPTQLHHQQQQQLTPTSQQISQLSLQHSQVSPPASLPHEGQEAQGQGQTPGS